MGAPTNFDTTRVRFGQMVSAVSGLVLIISLFLEWYNVSAKSAFVNVSQGASGWEALGFIDILLFLIGLIAIAVAASRAMNFNLPRLPASLGLIVLGLGVLAVLLTLFRIISIPDGGAGSIPGIDVGRSFGVFVAFLASVGVAVGGWLTWNEEGKPTPGSVGAGGPGYGAPLGQGQAPYGGQPQAPVGQPQQQGFAAQPPAAAAPVQPQAQPQAQP
ncbi:MAG: hypothetical protein QOC95_1406, partial [Thermoleophilaceae bacterium]|nr:hypothetical protein [Thermoleophilaceae bacterium]